MKRQGAAKVNTPNGPKWCHFSESYSTYKIRLYTNGTIKELDISRTDIIKTYTLEECKSLISAKSYKYTEIDVWTAILNKLESGIQPDKNPRFSQPTKPLVVPITRLREFYEEISNYDDKELQRKAKHFRENPKVLEDLWQVSQSEFKQYENKEGWGKSKRNELPPPPREPWTCCIHK